jgi:hypothetical protein
MELGERGIRMLGMMMGRSVFDLGGGALERCIRRCMGLG